MKKKKIRVNTVINTTAEVCFLKSDDQSIISLAKNIVNVTTVVINKVLFSSLNVC